MSFPLTPDYAYQVEEDFSTLISKMENGFEQRRPNRSRSIKTFKLIFKTKTQADMTSLQSLFETSLGQYGTFSYVDPNDGNTYNARFASDKLSTVLKAGAVNTSSAIYDLSCDIVQVLT